MSPSSHDSPQKLNSHSMDTIVDVESLSMPPTRPNGYNLAREATPSFGNAGLVTGEVPRSPFVIIPLVDAPTSLPLNGFHENVETNHIKPKALQSIEVVPEVAPRVDEFSFGGVVNRETDLQTLIWQESILKPHLKSVNSV
jgi:hypothetical protein